jgi:molecular chaperone IbpA
MQLQSPLDMFKDFDKFYVGFDDQYSKLAKLHTDMSKNIPNYPPYNIKKTGENTYVIELACAGFSKSQIEIELDGDKLYVRGNSADAEETASPYSNYLYHGIATRPFTRTFALNDQVEVKDAGMINGMLKIILERIIPEHKKPKKIDVKEFKEGSTIFGPDDE